MQIILCDSNEKILESLKKIINELLPTAGVVYFNNGKDILQYSRVNPVDVIICDIHMKDMLGTDLGKQLKKYHPHINIIFNSADESFKADALDLKVSGFITKPVTKAKVNKELSELRYPVEEERVCLRIQCFGNFSVFDNTGKLFKFTRSKEKEMLAYLIYKCGSEVSIKEIGAILFEDQAYDSKQQAYIQQLLFCLNKDLKAYGYEDVLVRNYNSISINTNLVDCDYFRFNRNDEAAKRMYNGEFMMQYEWADYVAAYLDRNLDD